MSVAHWVNDEYTEGLWGEALAKGIAVDNPYLAYLMSSKAATIGWVEDKRASTG
jgi:hypothetical protein